MTVATFHSVTAEYSQFVGPPIDHKVAALGVINMINLEAYDDVGSPDVFKLEPFSSSNDEGIYRGGVPAMSTSST